jgi:hypothetical protein
MILVAWDTDQIKRYVFATTKLREIRGASAILDDLNEEHIPAMVGPERIVYAGGGSAMAVVSDRAEAEDLIRRVARLYRRRTESAEITGALLEMNDPSVSFGEHVKHLNFKLRARKDEKRQRRSWLTSPVLKVCESCGQYPAESKSQEDLICRSCEIKRQESRRIRAPESISRLRQLLDYAKARGQWGGLSVRRNAPEDFNEIGENASPDGYIGFVYCDGNRMGALLSQLKVRESFRDFSKGIRQALREATFDALCRHFRDLKSDQTLPFEIIFIGGDDVVLVVAADKATEIAIDLCREFERRSEPVIRDVGVGWFRQRVSMSAAVVLSHASLPIYHLQAIADDLLESAKRKSLEIFEKQQKEVGCIDFHVVTASASDLPSIMRRTDWERTEQRPEGTLKLTLTERPYAAIELETLVGRIRALKASGFPSSKMQMLYEAIVDQSMTRAKSRWAFVAGRARKSEQPSKDQLVNLAAFFHPTVATSPCPWREREQDSFTTPMVDVAELYDFVK